MCVCINLAFIVMSRVGKRKKKEYDHIQDMEKNPECVY